MCRLQSGYDLRYPVVCGMQSSLLSAAALLSRVQWAGSFLASFRPGSEKAKEERPPVSYRSWPLAGNGKLSRIPERGRGCRLYFGVVGADHPSSEMKTPYGQ